MVISKNMKVSKHLNVFKLLMFEMYKYFVFSLYLEIVVFVQQKCKIYLLYKKDFKFSRFKYFYYFLKH